MSAVDDYYLDTAAHEGCKSWIYADTMGVPTVGIGFAILTEGELRDYRWDPSLTEAVADYKTVKHLEKGHTAEWYRPYTHARLGLDEILEVFDRKALQMIKRIEPMWHFKSQPLPVRKVLFDLSWQCGPNGLAMFRKLHTAVMRQDWTVAAQECAVSAASLERNEWRKQQFLSLLP